MRGQRILFIITNSRGVEKNQKIFNQWDLLVTCWVSGRRWKVLILPVGLLQGVSSELLTQKSSFTANLIKWSIGAFQLGRAGHHSVSTENSPDVLMSISFQEQSACPWCVVLQNFSQYYKEHTWHWSTEESTQLCRIREFEDFLLGSQFLLPPLPCKILVYPHTLSSYALLQHFKEESKQNYPWLQGRGKGMEPTSSLSGSALLGQGQESSQD